MIASFPVKSPGKCLSDSIDGRSFERKFEVVYSLREAVSQSGFAGFLLFNDSDPIYASSDIAGGDGGMIRSNWAINSGI